MQRHIPNMLTLGNLFSGALGIVLVFENKLEQAMILLLISAAFDFMDGFSARLLGVTSAIGKELDSLADVVSFGFFPSAVLYMLLKTDPAIVYGAYVAFLILLCSAYRLARFNVDEEQSDRFLGLNTPANALLLVSMPYWLNDALDITGLSQSTFLYILTVTTSVLLVSNVPFIALKFKSYRMDENLSRYILLGSSTILLFIFRMGAIPLIILMYTALSLLFETRWFGLNKGNKS
jgi:CDP-diacylglycerol--serine O-phosphatidyltransferase